MKQLKIGGNRKKGEPLPWLGIGATLLIGGGVLLGVSELLRMNGLEFLNQMIYMVLRAVTVTGGVVLLVTLLRKLPKTAYVRRMISVVGIVAVVSTWLVALMYSPYLRTSIGTFQNEGHKVAVIRSFYTDMEISDRLNAASEEFMVQAELAAREAQKKGETVEEVPDTVMGVDLLYVYTAYPVKFGILYDTNAQVEGNCFTLYNATSAKVKIDWPQPNVAHVYVEGVEGEGESFTTLN